jgi:xanthine/uracil permease
VAACFLILYGLSPKCGALLAVIPRPVMGGVFMLVCGSIVNSGMKLINSAPKTEGNGILIGLTLLLAIGLPVYAKASLGEWMSTVTPFVRMLFTNTVVIAVIVGILLNIIINHIVAKGDKF